MKDIKILNFLEDNRDTNILSFIDVCKRISNYRAFSITIEDTDYDFSINTDILKVDYIISNYKNNLYKAETYEFFSIKEALIWIYNTYLEITLN